MKTLGKLAIFATFLYGVVGIISPEDDGSVGHLQHRAKRYAPYSRNPLAYMNRLNQDTVVDDETLAMPIASPNKRFLYGRDEEPIRSHFRELRLKDNSRASAPSSSRGAVDSISSYPMLQRNTRRYTDPDAVDPNVALEDLSQQLAPLSDDELQTVLLMLDGYALGTQGATRKPLYAQNRYYKTTPEPYFNPSYLTPEDLRRVARMYEVGKRGNNNNNDDSGRFFDLDDSPAEPRVEFLTPKRSKRVGGLKKSNSVSRIKKETDPQVEAELEKAFEGPRALPLAVAPGSSSTTDQAVTTASHHDVHKATNSENAGQIPTPSGSKAKKAIDWSDYFGIDKKDKGATTKVSTEPETMKHAATDSSSSSTSTIATATAPKPKAMVASRITEPSKSGLKESKDHKKLREREENETENKSDRKWVLNEFYKNLAMAGNMKRKRDVSNNDVDDLAELEQKMEDAGDKIIWDAVKFTGAHKDEPLSPVELAQVKKDIIEKLATAYNLEMIREAIDNFREQLMAIKTNNV